MDYRAHLELVAYFEANLPQVESWFNVIRPDGRHVHDLRGQINKMRDKDWGNYS